MKQRSKISEYCEMIRELVGNNTSVISFLKLIQTCDEELTRKINVKNAEIDELKKVIERKQGAFTQLRVMDTDTGLDHIIGSNQHDALYVEDGKVRYYNMQDGGSDGDGYRFVEKMLW